MHWFYQLYLAIGLPAVWFGIWLWVAIDVNRVLGWGILIGTIILIVVILLCAYCDTGGNGGYGIS